MNLLQFLSLMLGILFMTSLTQAELPLVVPVLGKSFPADLVEADADWRLIFHTGQTRQTIPAADLVCWGYCPQPGRAGGLVLAGGAWLPSEIQQANGDRLTAESAVFGNVSLEWNRIAGVVFRWPSNQIDRDKLFFRICTSPIDISSMQTAGQGIAPQERVARLLLTNGDELSGRCVGLANGVLKFQTDVGQIDVEIDRAVAMILGAESDNLSGLLRAWAGFRDGARLVVEQLLLKDDSLTVVADGRRYKATKGNLVFLQPLGGRVVYLSDLEPVDYSFQSFFMQPSSTSAFGWPWQSDRNVCGGFLRCGDRIFMKGLGVHSAARLAFNLGEGQGSRAEITPKYFAAELAVDDCAGGQGSVVFRVFVDRREKFTSPVVRGGQTPLPISVDVAGAHRLELWVDFADRADVLDRADWLNARLIN